MKYIVTLFLILACFLQVSAQTNELESVLILNEGNFNAGNATLTIYDPEINQATDGVFLSANGVSLGDVGQSLRIINGDLYIVMNNSQKIVVADPKSFAQKAVITLPEGASPREIVAVSEQKAFVTDLYANALYVVDLEDYSVSPSAIPVGTNPDKMLYN